MTRTTTRLLAAVAVAPLVLLAACGAEEEPAGSGDGAGDKVKIAAIFSGPTNDADYNAIGLKALKAAETAGAEISFSEKVAVPDVEARLTEAVGDGATVVWTHGSQFYDATAKVAKNNPDVTFIAEYDGVPKDQPANVWTIDRQFHLGFYGMGVFASKLSKTGTVGYVGGLSLPFSMAEVHAMEQAIKDTGADDDDQARLDRRLQRRRQGAAVLHPAARAGRRRHRRLAQPGLHRHLPGVRGQPGRRRLGHRQVHRQVRRRGRALRGQPRVRLRQAARRGPRARSRPATTKGNYPLGFDTGVTIKMADGVPADVKAAVDKAMADVKSGAVKVELDTAKIG